MPAVWTAGSSLLVLAVFALAIGCRGAGPQRQPLVLTEDPAVRTPGVQPPPQRLAVSERPAKATRQVTSTKPLDNDPVRTRLATTRPEQSVKQVAHSKSVEPRRTVAKQPASDPVVSSARPSSHKPSRSDAVEALLAANRKTTRSRQGAKVQANPQRKPTAPVQSVAAAAPAKATPARTTSAKTMPAKTRFSPARTTAKAKAQSVAKKTTGKTVRFSDLPDDVKRRAMDRLIENLAKEAVPSVQPASPKQGVASALSNLPKLAPLRKTKPEIPPTRIASNRPTQSKRTASSQQVAQKRQGAQVNKDHVRKETPSRKEIQPTRSIAKVSVPPPPSEPKGAPPSRKVVVRQAIAEASGFELPPMDQIRKSLPKLDAAKVVMARDAVADQWTLPVETNLANAKASSQLVATEIDAEYEEIRKDADAIELTVSALARELEVMPHALERDAFRVSRVGLPDPDDYFAFADQEIRQASSQGNQEQGSLQSVELASSLSREHAIDLPKRAGQKQLAAEGQQPAQQPVQSSAPRVSAGELAKHHHVASESATPAFDLPTRLDSTPTVNKHQIALPSTKAVASVSTPNTAIKNLSENRTPAAITESPTRVAKAKPEDLSMDSAGKVKPEAVAKVVAQFNPESLSDRELYDALLKRLSDPSHAESPAEQSRRQIMARHLMVLAGDREAAVAQMQGLSTQEQQFLRNQLEGLHTMVDPKGHPVAGRRFSQALPKLRQATQHLSAAADSLEVRGLEFCTEIEAYGQVKPFPNRDFAAGQAVILYCEVDRFTAKKTESGFETHLKGSYDVFDQSGVKVVSQLLPADKQLSSNFLRDYFVAYQMNLPSKLAKGKYRLQLTMEDIGGEKYGQAEIDFEITREAAEVRQAGGTL